MEERMMLVKSSNAGLEQEQVDYVEVFVANVEK